MPVIEDIHILGAASKDELREKIISSMTSSFGWDRARAKEAVDLGFHIEWQVADLIARATSVGSNMTVSLQAVLIAIQLLEQRLPRIEERVAGLFAALLSSDGDASALIDNLAEAFGSDAVEELLRKGQKGGIQ